MKIKLLYFLLLIAIAGSYWPVRQMINVERPQGLVTITTHTMGLLTGLVIYAVLLVKLLDQLSIKFKLLKNPLFYWLVWGTGAIFALWFMTLFGYEFRF